MSFNAVKKFLHRYNNAVFFIGGFLFDALTLIRIDSLLDIAIQAVYLGGISALLVLQSYHQNEKWSPRGWTARVWPYETEILHFFYGGLLSAYTVLYFKSTSFSRSFIFLSLVVFLMVANEMPQIRRAGAYLRLGLYAFCVVSFLNYLLPVLIGHMGWGIFLLAWLLSVGLTYAVVGWVSRPTPNPRIYFLRRSAAPAVVLLLILILYVTKLIPPVPMSVQYVGIYRDIQKVGNRYKLVYRKPPWMTFWRKEERIFLAKEGDALHCFVRVFAPSRFEHEVVICWSRRDENSNEWISQDRIPIMIKGGRDEGYRGTTVKNNFSPGHWRVEVETSDGRTLGIKNFDVKADLGENPPELESIWM